MSEREGIGLVDHRGRPLAPSTNGHAPSRNGAVRGKFLNQFNAWWQSLADTRMPAFLRAQDPFSNHPWVFAAAMLSAVVGAQAPFTIFREDDDTLEMRRLKEMRVARVKTWNGPRAGDQRRALQRHARMKDRVFRRGLEPFETHPLNDVLARPNPLQRGAQLWQMTFLWLKLRGMSFWILAGPDSAPLPPGQQPAEIWPISPDLFEPVFDHGTFGRLIGWKLRSPRFFPRGGGQGSVVWLQLHEVAQFKLPNPNDLISGMSPLGPVASSVEADLLAKAHARGLLENRAMPGGFITTPELDDEQELEMRGKIEEHYKGPNKTGRPAIFADGVKWNAVSWNMKDIQAFELLKSDREEILAVLGTPPAVLGLEDVSNYATALVHDESFWKKNVLPMLTAVEQTIDATLLYPETDDVVGLFDLSEIDAFRAGLREKVEIADRMTGPGLHVEPRLALETVGLDVPDYLGDDVVLVPAIQTPLRDLLSAGGESASPPARPGVVPPADEEEDEVPVAGEDDVAPLPEAARRARAPAIIVRKPKLDVGKRGRQFVKLEVGLEGGFRRGYRNWIQKTRADVLRAFDEVVGSKVYGKAPGDTLGDYSVVLPPRAKMQADLSTRMRPAYAATLEEVYSFTADGELGGVPTFSIDDPALMQVFDTREDIFLEKVPDTVVDNLRTSLAKGIAEGDTVQELRLRIGNVFDIASSSSKALQVARTETGAMMNGVRDAMFGLQGFTLEGWGAADDEHTRDDHVLFGQQDPLPRGFDYLTLPGVQHLGGELHYPGDSRANASQVVNCRCFKYPVE